MTIEELESKLTAFIKVGMDISGLFEEFKNTNKITPNLKWTKVHDVFVTKIGESTICVGTFSTPTRFSIVVTGKYPVLYENYPTNAYYETPQACMDAVQKALS